MAHSLHRPGVTGLHLAAASATFARIFKDQHPQLDCIFTGASVPFLWWQAARFAASEGNTFKCFRHLGLAVSEGWLSQVYPWDVAVVDVSIARFEGENLVAIPQEKHLSIIRNTLLELSKVRDSEYVGLLCSSPERPPINFRVKFLQSGQQHEIGNVHRLQISNDLYETPLILVENPAPLLKNSLEGIFDQSTPISEHHPSLHWTTLLIFCLVVQAWNLDKVSRKQRVLPEFPFTHQTFQQLLESEARKHPDHHAQRQLEEIDEHLCEVNYAAQSKRRDEAKSSTIRDAFHTLDDLLAAPHSATLHDPRQFPALDARLIPTFPPSKFIPQRRGTFDVEAQAVGQEPREEKKGYLESIKQRLKMTDNSF